MIRAELKRCMSIERRWNRNEVSGESLVPHSSLLTHCYGYWYVFKMQLCSCIRRLASSVGLLAKFLQCLHMSVMMSVSMCVFCL